MAKFYFVDLYNPLHNQFITELNLMYQMSGDYKDMRDWDEDKYELFLETFNLKEFEIEVDFFLKEVNPGLNYECRAIKKQFRCAEDATDFTDTVISNITFEQAKKICEPTENLKQNLDVYVWSIGIGGFYYRKGNLLCTEVLSKAIMLTYIGGLKTKSN